jgi:hypothetical protein
MSRNIRPFLRLLSALVVLSTLILSTILLLPEMNTSRTYAEYVPGIPSAVDPGTPNFTGSSNPVPAEPVAYDPSTSMLQAIFDADVAAGGTSYWFDRVLERSYLSADYHNFC